MIVDVDHLSSPGSDKNEDSYFIGNKINGVFDGYSSVFELTHPSKKRTGKVVAETAKKEFSHSPAYCTSIPVK